MGPDLRHRFKFTVLGATKDKAGEVVICDNKA